MEGNPMDNVSNDLDKDLEGRKVVKYPFSPAKATQLGHELQFTTTADDQTSSKFSLNDSILKISRKLSVSNDSMASLFSRKGSSATSTSTISTSSVITSPIDNQFPIDTTTTVPIKHGGFNSTLGKLWSKKGPLPQQQQQQQQQPSMGRNRSNSTPTSLHSNSLPLPRKLSMSGPFKRIMSNPITQIAPFSQQMPPTSRSSSTSISTNPDYGSSNNDTFSTPMRTPPAISGLSVNTNSTLLPGGERSSPVDVVDIADEYFFRNPSMTINESDDIDQDVLVSPNTFHSSQFNLPEHSGWALQDGVLISQDDTPHQLQMEPSQQQEDFINNAIQTSDTPYFR